MDMIRTTIDRVKLPATVMTGFLDLLLNGIPLLRTQPQRILGHLPKPGELAARDRHQTRSRDMDLVAPGDLPGRLAGLRDQRPESRPRAEDVGRLEGIRIEVLREGREQVFDIAFGDLGPEVGRGPVARIGRPEVDRVAATDLL